MNKPCISIDVEDWLQSTWDRNLPISQISAENTLKLLDILDELSITTTMFIQGKFARAFPNIVKQINNCGHEVASHGYAHIEIFEQTQAEFREDLLISKNIIEDLISKKIIGYRAPDFSITKKSLWAFEILAELGFEYDSSVFPIKHSRYGICNFSSEPIKIKLKNGSTITEYPIATFRVFNKNLPIGGGGYHRLIPGLIFRAIASHVIKSQQFIFYCHPYEFNSEEFSNIKADIPIFLKLHQGMGRKFFEVRFRQFVKKFGSQKISELHMNSKWREIELNETAFN